MAEKRDIVYRTIETFLVEHPGVRQAEPKIGLRLYSVLRTPFVIVYDFDDDELRLHFIFHRRASLEDLDPAAAEW